MKRSSYHFASQNSLVMIFCLVFAVALLSSGLYEASSFAAGGGTPLANSEVQLAAPTNSLCVGGNITLTSKTYVRPAPCANVGFPGAGYNSFGFNLTGCATTATINMVTCTSNGCPGQPGATTIADTVIAFYRSAGGTVNAFNEGAPSTNFVSCNDDFSGCGTLSNLSAASIANGHFVVVVSGFDPPTLSGSRGTFQLFVSTTCGTITAEPTAVDLDAFTATGYDDGTLLEWRTGLEVKNLGFNVYRELGGKRTRLNDQVLGGSALRVGPSVNLRSGNSYAWTDTSPTGKKTRYWLEDLGLDGQSTWHGPFNVDRSAPGDRLPPPSKGRAQLLSKLGTDASQAGQTTPVPRTANSPEMSAMAFTTQPSLALGPAMKLSVKQEGWYRVSSSELGAAGFDTKTDPRLLQMFVDGQEQAISVAGEQDGRFDSSDAVEFYGVGLDSGYTISRTYWLVSGSRPGLRIQTIKGGGSRAAPASFPYTVERRDRTIYFSALRNGEKENFFGAVIARDAVSQSINVQHLDSASSSGAELELALQGVTELSHRVRVELNGVEVGYTGFDGQAEGTTRIPLGRGALKEGQNIVRLTALGGDGDVSLVDYIQVNYPHTYMADNDALRFAAQAGQQVSIGGFTSSAIRVFDVTDPGAVSEVATRAQLQKSGGYTVTVSAPDGRGDRLLMALANSRVSRPAGMSPNRPSNLRWPAQGTDMVIITHRAFLDAVGPLKAARESQGLSVAVVDVEDVYDEFSFGQKSPQAIKDFLAFAATGWQRPPRFVLLVGEGSLDPKGYLGFGDSDFVPTKLIDTRLMETASDDWFADFNDKGLAQMAIGRLPIRTAGEAATVISKIINYDRSESSNGVLLVADSNDGYDFESFSSGLRGAIPPDMKVSEIRRGQTDPATAQSELIAALGQGQRMVNYVGHGNVDQWRGNLLTSATARGLINSHLPLFVSMTCLNGYFQDPVLESLAESLMKAERGGAVAVWASSGMTTPAGQLVLNQQMFNLVLDSPGSLTLGEATVKAKSAVTDSDVRRTWILFGDPTMKLR
jgi:hypothetical protein